MVHKRRSKRNPVGSNSKFNESFGGLLLLGICLTLVVVTVFFIPKVRAKGEIDANTLCHTSGVKNVTSVLLDLTDPLSITQQTRLRNILDIEIGASSIDTMIAVGIVSEDSSNWGAAFAKCKPATSKDSSALYENPKNIGERFQREFAEPLKSTLNKMLSGEVENSSPIMEALQSLVAETPNFASVAGNRKIIIVSDLLQHSDKLSFYRGENWNSFSKNNGEGQLARNLTDVKVEIIRIPRAGAKIPPTKIIDEFWSRYLDKQGSYPPRVISLGDL